MPQYLATCSWDRPGLDPYSGPASEAINRYRDVFTPAQIASLQRMAAERKFTERVFIDRDQVIGARYRYGAALERMHFGAGKVCGRTTRSGWPAGYRMEAVTLVVPGATHALILPAGCGNWSLVRLLPAVLDEWTPAVEAPAERPLTPREQFDAQRAEASRPRIWLGQGDALPWVPDGQPEAASAVPEPPTWGVLAFAALGFVLARRQRGR